MHNQYLCPCVEVFHACSVASEGIDINSWCCFSLAARHLLFQAVLFLPPLLYGLLSFLAVWQVAFHLKSGSVLPMPLGLRALWSLWWVCACTCHRGGFRLGSAGGGLQACSAFSLQEASVLVAVSALVAVAVVTGGRLRYDKNVVIVTHVLAHIIYWLKIYWHTAPSI